MTTLNRVVVEWAGAGVTGRAVTVLHYSASDNAAPPVAAIRDAFFSIASAFPAGLTIQVPGTGDKIDDTTGNLTGTWSAVQPPTVNGAGLGKNAAGVGACIGWTTGGIVPGKKGPRKLRGRTFLVPIQNDCFDTNGTLDNNTRNAMETAAGLLMAAGPLAIWHRPNAALGLTGNSYGVISHRVRDKIAYLSSRRD